MVLSLKCCGKIFCLNARERGGVFFLVFSRIRVLSSFVFECDLTHPLLIHEYCLSFADRALGFLSISRQKQMGKLW